MNVGLQKVESFVTKKLPAKLKWDLQSLRMVREADLECCTYYHLSRFLRRQPGWRFFARKFSLHTDHYVDLLLFQQAVPRIAIELKWNQARISEKDRQSLCRCIESLHVNRAYFITTLIGTRNYSHITKEPLEKGRLFEIIIPLPLAGAELKQWQQERRKYTSKMHPRKRKRDAG